jgi:hypothetical protein
MLVIIGPWPTSRNGDHMPKMTPEERADLEARLAADDEDDDSDDVSVTFPDGFSFSGTFRRAQEVAAAHGFKLKPDPKPADDAPKGKSAGKGGNVTQGRFSGRRIS